jgi:peptidoglycan/LPS O-acetylase OafA/YrhL
MPALDGLRALAVMAVVLYHGEVSGLPGGFLGVEVFFVISGYLITALLISERQRTGGTDYLAFWARRARRLLPALFALAAVVGLVWVLFVPSELARIRGDFVAALTYVINWYQIIVHQSYFDAIGRPSPLRHLWSLAVEEQFYIVWPLALAGIYRITGGRRGRMVLVTTAMAVASAIWGFMLFTPGVDPSRVYYGTDTRASGVLLGAVLAIAVPPWRMRATLRAGGRWVITGIGMIGLVGIAFMILRVNEFDPFVYQGGFVLVDLLTMAMILALVHPANTVLAKSFSVSPLLWIGRRSYGIYLWHWPIFVLTRPGVDVDVNGWLLLALRLILTFAIAEVSYRFVEMPVRDGALGRWWAGRSQPGGLVPARARRPVLLVSAITLCVVLAFAVATPSTASLHGVDLTGASIDEVGNVIDVTTTLAPATSTPAPSTPAPSATAPPVEPGAPVSTTTTVPPVQGIGASTIAIGDSVLLGACSAVRNQLPGITVNADVGRQFNVLSWLIPVLRDSGDLRPTVVINLGTNGPPTESDLRKALDNLADVRRVVLVTIRAPRGWQDLTNDRIRAAAEGRSNVVVADWYSMSAGHPEFFVTDGVHLTVAGADAYAMTLASAVR